MWDDAEALRKLSKGLLVASALLLLLIALLLVLRLPVFSLRAVQFDVAPGRVDPHLLVRAARESLQGNFFTVDLDRARQAFERLPWVRRVEVRRHFPWQLDVTLEEHVALARWNGTSLVDVQGEVFSGQSDGVLPEFVGPDGAEGEVVRLFARFSETLEPAGMKIGKVVLTGRHAWQLQLKGGMVLDLGREQMEERVARFAAAYPQYKVSAKAPGKYIDLRYRNGFAVKMAAD